MVTKGDIIELNFDPQKGHEQAGFRPALVISNAFFNSRTNFAIVVPITNTKKNFPLHIPLDDRTKTTGFLLCEHIKSVDLSAREYSYVEKIPLDLLDNVVSTVFAEIG